MDPAGFWSATVSHSCQGKKIMVAYIKCYKTANWTPTRRQNLAEAKAQTPTPQEPVLNLITHPLIPCCQWAVFQAHNTTQHSKTHRLPAAADTNQCQGPSSPSETMLLYRPTAIKQANTATYVPFPWKGLKWGWLQQQPALAPTGDSNLSGNPSLLLMRVMMKGEGDSSIPGSLQHRVLQSSFISTVVPLGEVRGTVRSLRRRPHLVAIHTSATLDPETEPAQSQCIVPLLLWLLQKMQPTDSWISSPPPAAQAVGCSDRINYYHLLLKCPTTFCMWQIRNDPHLKTLVFPF